jgi:hypothetical protein
MRAEQITVLQVLVDLLEFRLEIGIERRRFLLLREVDRLDDAALR